jgi:4'-phosphopantetheinyl transferase
LETNPHGKPVLADPSAELHFNLAHSGDLAIFAFARDCIPGVDAESLERAVDHDALAQRFFSAREYAELQRIPEAGRNRAFLACWTCKEAIAKAIGRGLSLPLNQIEVAVDPAAPLQVLNVPQGDPREWKLHRIDAGSPYVATLALYCPLKKES